MKIINEPTVSYTFHLHNSKGTLDLTSCGKNTWDLMSSLNDAYPGISSSAHLYIVYEVKSDRVHCSCFRYKTKFINYSNTLNYYLENLQNEFEMINLSLNPWAEIFQEILNFIID